MRKVIFILLMTMFLGANAQTEIPSFINNNSIYRAKNAWDTVDVRSVRDGDNFKCNNPYFEDEIASIRFLGIDAPEIYSGGFTKTQPFGREIGDSLRSWIKLKKVQYQYIAYDIYDRSLCNVRFEDGEDLCYRLLIRGYAWYKPARSWPRSSKLTSEQQTLYRVAQNYAKENKLGLWAGHYITLKNGNQKWVAPIDPAVWRRKYHN